MDEQLRAELMKLGQQVIKRALESIKKVLIALAAVQGDEGAQAQAQEDPEILAAAMVMLEMSEQLLLPTYAKNGAKLDYLRLLKGKCPEGYEVVYMKQGGSALPIKTCKKCQEGKKMSAIEEFKCGGKKKVKKAGEGTKSPKITSSKNSQIYP